jgi:CDGSH-type Zn-finger protein
MADETTITPLQDGPYRIEGPLRLTDSAGQAWPLEPGKPVSLCRCGQSEHKPFCDGSHRRAGFTADTRAPE